MRTKANASIARTDRVVICLRRTSPHALAMLPLSSGRLPLASTPNYRLLAMPAMFTALISRTSSSRLNTRPQTVFMSR